MGADPRGPSHGNRERAGVNAGTRLSAAIPILGAIALAACLIVPRTHYPLSFDALHSYLPMARGVLEQGWAFMQRPESLATAPVGYLWPALFGADATTTRWANVALFGATIALAFHAARLAHSWQAGALAAFLIAISPTLRPFVADVLTEPPFFLLIAVWIVAVARTASGSGTAWIAAGGIALALATLTRPAIMYFAPVMVVVFLAMKERRLAAMHAIVLAGTALWILRNAITFGFPAVATGAGAALFLGVNPLVDGFDPVFFGLMYDEGAAARDMSHLSLVGDRILRGVAVVELRDTPLTVLAEMFARKAAALLFFTSVEDSVSPVALVRSWRIVLIVFAVAAVMFRARSRVVLSLAALVAYMLLVHLPVLYHPRYSVGSIDIALTLLAAIGIAESFARPGRLAAATVAATLGVGAGLLVLEPGLGSPRIERTPSQLIWSRDARQLDHLRLENLVLTGPATFALAPGAAMELTVSGAPLFHPWDISMATFEIAVTPAAKTTGCQAMRLRYRKPEEERFAPEHVARVALRSDGRMHRITVGAAPLAMNHEGLLRIEFECAFPATLEMGTISIAAPRRATYYRELYLKETEHR